MQTINIAELTTAQLGNRDTIRDNSKYSEPIVKIPLDKIVIREGFNVRQDYGDLQQLAYSILENGQVLPGRVDALADGTFLLTDGHRRYQAALLLAEMGDEPLFKAVINTTKTTEEQRILQMFTTQDNKQLTPSEVAELIKRLVNLGYNQTEVAKKIGRTPAYISQMLSFANESPVIKQHVKAGKLTVSTALEIQKQIPVQSERVEAINNAVANTKEDKRVKVADVAGTKKAAKPTDKAEVIAKEIAEYYGIKDDMQPMINIIKSHL